MANRSDYSGVYKKERVNGSPSGSTEFINSVALPRPEASGTSDMGDSEPTDLTCGVDSFYNDPSQSESA